MSVEKRSRGQHRVSGWASFGGSSLAGVAEVAVFHPVDTVAKRLMNSRTKALALTLPSLTLNLTLNINIAIALFSQRIPAFGAVDGERDDGTVLFEQQCGQGFLRKLW